MQAAQGTALLGNQQHAGGVAIQPVHQFEETGFGAQSTQPFDDTKTQAAAAVHCHAGRLVEHYHGVVFKQDLTLQTLDAAEVGRRQLILLGHTHGGHPHLVTGTKLVFRFDALLVDPHLPFSKDAINQALGDAL